MSAEPQVLTDLAASVADGSPIDWDVARKTLGPREQRLVRHLHLVSSVAELYRSLPADEGGTSATATEPQGPRWGPLVILDSLGKGTTAEVFRAWDVTLQREVALKLFPPDQGEIHIRERILSEARRLARVRHANVAAVYGAERHNDRVGFWMELVDGASLDDVLERQGPLATRDAALIGSEIASALAAVHGVGLLHRDVKAQNVVREQTGRIVLTDFGTGHDLNAPVPTVLAGTPMYLAPEILRGKPASIQSDIYSLGVLLFLLSSGKFPVDARTMSELVRGHAEGVRRPLREVRPEAPPRFAEVVDKALDESPGNRFATATEFAEALRESVEPDRTLVGRSLTSTPMAPASHRAFLLLALAAVMTLAVALPSWRGTGNRPGSQTRVNSLAVLPLQDATGRHSELAEAMTDQLIATLGQIGALRVTSRNSVQPFQGPPTTVTEIARRLGVDAVLQGTMTAGPPAEDGGNRIQIAARLLAAGSGAELWSGRFDAAPGNLAATETAIAKSIARGIRLAVSPSEADRLRSGARTSPQAEEAYFQGRYQLGQYGVDSARRALSAFQRAITLDPEHAAAHAALARTYVTLGFNGALSQPEARDLALAAANRASEIDADLSEVQTAVGDLRFYYDWDWKGADAAYRRAVDLGPSSAYARTQYARYLAAAGRLPEAVEQTVQASALDPLSPEAAQTEGLIRYYARDFAGAEASLQRAVDIDPNYARAHYVLGRVLEAEGRIPEAVASTEHAMALAREPGSSWNAQLSRLHALAGESDRARREAADLARGALHAHPENLAYTYLALGDLPRAIALLNQAADEREPSLLWLAVDPRVDPLRESASFNRLLARLGKP